MGAERRQHPRHPVLYRVDYADEKGRAWWGLLRDLSPEGVFIEYAPTLAVSDTVVITFTVPDGTSFKLKAHVVRVTATGAALKFIGFSAHGSAAPSHASLEAHCAALAEAWLVHPEGIHAHAEVTSCAG